jgi:PAS domain S-box-containing protein
MSSSLDRHAAARRPTDVSNFNLNFLAEGGEMGARMRAFDWTRTPLGPPERWPQSLRTIVRVMLDSRYAMWMLWGPELTFFCNDAYLPTLGMKRDWALGARSDKVWEEIWPDIGPRITQVLEAGRATWDDALLLYLERSGFAEETYHTFSYSPVYDDESRIAGMLCVVTEVTEKVIGERRLRILRDLAARGAGVTNVEESCSRACEVIDEHPFSMPLAGIYLFDSKSPAARRVACTRGRERVLPALIEESTTNWPIAALLAGETAQHMPDLPGLGLTVTAGPWPDLVRDAFLLPLKGSGGERPVGFLLVGASPRRVLNEAYRTFFGLVAGQISATIADAQALEAERRRAAVLAELDRAKTAFFSNVSHEFRTPLTLMLGPIEEAAAHATAAPVRAYLELAHRNSLRLLKLVNSLLDFARIEAGRMQPSYEPTDLGAFTRELASTFQSAIERAGLGYAVECADLGEPVFVDREMWEKVVLNLLSNAFKYTFEGHIAVRIHREDSSGVLEVSDTGVGIPEHELPRLFERFHRVEGTAGRTQEGSGIGLALVQELVKLHGGTIGATSKVGAGTTFRISLPLGAAHLPAERIKAPRALASTAVGAKVFVQEALRWIPAEASSNTTSVSALLDSERPTLDQRFAHTVGARVLIADDNADMRSYLQGLLSPAYRVETVGDGEQALESARRERPDLILSDIMMPRLDGLALLKRLRTDALLRDVPIVLLSARAGEEARVEGLDAGADDYLVKPFSARELLARLGALLELTQMRRQHEERLQLALSSIHEQFFVLDRHWRYTVVNPRVSEITGRTENELLHRPIFEIFPDLKGTLFESELRTAVETNVPRRFEFEYAQHCFENFVYPAADGVAVLVTDITERKRTEEALREREEQLRLATEAAEIGLWDVDLIEDKLFWPARVKAMFGISPDVPVSMADFYAGLHPADRERTSAAFAAALDPQQRALYDVEYRTVGKEDGLIRWVAARGRGIFDGSGTCVRVIGTAIDITERKQAQEALGRTHAELESRMAELARFAQAATGRERRVMELKEEVNALRRRLGESDRYSLAFAEDPPSPAEPDTPESEGLVPLETIVRTNALRTRASRPPDYATEIQALSRLMQAIAQDPRSILQTLADITLETLQSGSAGLSLLTRDRQRFYWAAIAGEWSAHRGGGTPRGFGPCGDVIDRNEPILFTHWELRYPYLATATPLAEEGLLVPFYLRGEAVGTIWVIAHDSTRRFEAEDLRLLESLARFATLAYQAVEFLGMVDQNRAALNLLEDAVEAREQAEQSNRRLRESEEALDQANRRKDEFLAMLAHELRNPLAPIGNASAILSQMLARDERAKLVIEMIKRQVTQLTRLVDDLLDVSRITQGRIELEQRSVDLAAVITQALETVEPQLREKRHEFTVTALSYEPLYVRGDFARLVQCIGNILTNAVKYTEPQGKISVRTHGDEDSAHIEVADSGTGITPELLPRIFDLFVQSERTLDRSQGGLGIGLAVVKQLVEMHKGEVSAHSAGPGQGATFKIRLPRIARPAATAVEAAPVARVPRRVLIVDDNEDAANSLAMLLKLNGHETHVAYSAKDALVCVEDFKPDVGLLDIGLPEMHGYELAKRLRASPKLQGLCLIALTGYGQAEDRARALAAGFDAHLVKPLDLSAFDRILAGISVES